MFQFGIGGLFARPTGGNLATPSFPQQFGTLQDVNVDIDQKLVELRGKNKFPDDIAPSDMSIKGKAAFARLEVEIYNALFFGDSIATGVEVIVQDEAGTVSSNAVTVAGNGTFDQDLGVRYANGAGALQKVGSGNEAVGKYSVVESGNGKGVYTFASGDNNTAMLLSYRKSDGSNGRTLTVTNRLQGYGPTFEIYLSMPYQGNNALHLLACRASKMSAPAKRDGYVIADFEFQAFADASGNVLKWYQVTA